MTPEKIELLRASAPSVWGQANHFGFDDGWFEIVRDLGLELEKLGATSSGGKEKYATLDIFISSPDPPYGTPSIQAAVKRAVEKSRVTCEVCGEPGRHVETENMWESIKCRKHQGDSQPTSPDADYVEASEPHKPMPDPTEEQLKDPIWNSIYQTIKSWDVNVPEFYNGYCGANGSHATLIYEAVKKALSCTPDPDWGCEARRKLGVARGALYTAREAIEDQQAMPDQGPLDAIDKALADTAQPQPCEPLANLTSEEDAVEVTSPSTPLSKHKL